MMKILNYFSIGILLTIAACNSVPEPASSQPDQVFSFAFLTDIHLQPEQEAVKGFQRAIDSVNSREPDFVITGGDLVMDVLNQSYGRADSLFHLYQEVSQAFQMPVYNCVGNHEVYGWHRQEEGLEEHPEFGKKMYEKRLGERFYSFQHKGWHFIILDAISRGADGHYFGKIDEEQVEWLRQDLRKVEGKTPISVTVHIPFVTSMTQLTRGALQANNPGLVISNSREVLGLFSEHNLRLVLQGHLHFLEDIYVQDQVHFITGGAVCGKWWGNTPESKPEEGFLMLYLQGDQVEWEYVDYGWTPPA